MSRKVCFAQFYYYKNSWFCRWLCAAYHGIDGSYMYLCVFDWQCSDTWNMIKWTLYCQQSYAFILLTMHKVLHTFVSVSALIFKANNFDAWGN